MENHCCEIWHGGAPLKAGSFCQRRDTHTCPFHGPIMDGRRPPGTTIEGRRAGDRSGEPSTANGPKLRRDRENEGPSPVAEATEALVTPITAREQRALDRAHNQAVLIAASGDSPKEAPVDQEQRGGRAGKRKLNVRQRLLRKLGDPRVVAAAAEHLDRLDDTRRQSRFSEQW